jgi:transposase, IS6 family
MSSRCPHPTVDRSEFAGFRFPLDVIAVAVRWYLRFGLSDQVVEELLAERGIVVDHVTVYRWCSGSRRCSSTTPALPALARRPLVRR